MTASTGIAKRIYRVIRLTAEAKSCGRNLIFAQWMLYAKGLIHLKIRGFTQLRRT